MNLVHEENRLASELETLLGGGDYLAYPRNSLGDGGEWNELAIGVVSDEPPDRCFSRARRAPENHGCNCSALDRFSEWFAGIEQMMLSYQRIESLGANASSEWLG
jgi:hypothetical protein